MGTASDSRSYNSPDHGLEGGEVERRLDRLENAVASLQQKILAGERLQNTPQPPNSPGQQAGYRTEDDSAPGEVLPRRKPTIFGILRWLFQEILPELRGMVSMFFDPRYELGIPVRMATFGLLILMVTTTWWVPFSSVPVLGFVLDRTMMLASGYMLFRLLSSESRKYRQTAPALPANLRWAGRGER